MQTNLFNQLPSFAYDFLTYMQTIKNKSNTTIQEYFYDLRGFLRFITIIKQDRSKIFQLDNNDLEKVNIKEMPLLYIEESTLSDLYAYMSYLTSKRKNNARTRARKVASIKSFYNYLYKKANLIHHNPASELESPKIMKQLPKYLTLSESKKLLSSVSGKHAKRDYLILTLFLNCGLRVSEMSSINLSNIKNDTITVLGKGNKERNIYLNDACKYALEAYLIERPNDKARDRDALFISDRYTRLSVKTIQYLVKKYVTEAGLDPKRYSAHKLRHTAATLMYRHGQVDIRSLQEILGHESIQTTEIYTHVENKELKDAISKNPLSSIKRKE